MRQIFSLVFSFLLVGNLAFAQNIPWYKRIFLKKKSVIPIERWDLKRDSRRGLRQRDFLRAQLDSFFYYYFNQADAPQPAGTAYSPVYPETSTETPTDQMTQVIVSFPKAPGQVIFKSESKPFSTICTGIICSALFNITPSQVEIILDPQFVDQLEGWGGETCTGLKEPSCVINLQKGQSYSLTVNLKYAAAAASYEPLMKTDSNPFQSTAAKIVISDTIPILQRDGKDLSSGAAYILATQLPYFLSSVRNKIPNSPATELIDAYAERLLINKDLSTEIALFVNSLMRHLDIFRPISNYDVKDQLGLFNTTAKIFENLNRLLSQTNIDLVKNDINNLLWNKNLLDKFRLQSISVDDLNYIAGEIEKFIKYLTDLNRIEEVSLPKKEAESLIMPIKIIEESAEAAPIVEVKLPNKINLATAIRALATKFVNTAIEKLGLQGLSFRTHVEKLKKSPLFRRSSSMPPPQSLSIENSRFLAQVIVNRDKLLAQKSTYQDKFWKNYNSVGETVDKTITSNLIYNGSDNSYRSESGIVKENLKSCLTRTLDNKISTSVLEDENEVFGYVLWFFDETIDSISRILKSDKPDNEKIEKVVNIVRGCQKLSNSIFSSVKDYKDKVLEIMNKDVLVSAPAKATKAFIDSIKITAYGDFSESAYGDLGKANNCNSLVNDKETGSVEWTSIDKAGISDNLKAETSLNSGQTSYWLKATDCKIPVPSSSKRITGFKVEIERAKSGSDVIKDFMVKMVKGNKMVGISNTTSSDWTTSDLIVTYGSSTEAWGETWTAADVKDSGFGVAITVKNEGPKPAAAASTQTTSQAVTTKTATSQAAQPETPVQKMVKYLNTKSLKPGDNNEHVSTLQTEVLIKFKGKGNPAEALDKALKGNVKPGKYGNATAEAVFFLKQILASWAEKNKKTENENFAAVIKEVKSVTVKKAVFSQEFTLKTWKAFLDYAKGVSAK